MLTLPENNRHFFKEPFGTLFPDIADALPHITGKTLYAVGDIVTHNLKKKGLVPAVAVIDGHTMRSPCTKNLPVTGRHIRVTNPAGTLTDDLIAAIRDAVHNPPATIDVEGEEDLAVIPLVIAAPEGGVVLYGQPQKGVVVRTIDKEAKERAEELFARFVRF
jgi:uncharacterized protein (UPF0218 family)